MPATPPVLRLRHVKSLDGVLVTRVPRHRTSHDPVRATEKPELPLYKTGTAPSPFRQPRLTPDLVPFPDSVRVRPTVRQDGAPSTPALQGCPKCTHRFCAHRGHCSESRPTRRVRVPVAASRGSTSPLRWSTIHHARSQARDWHLRCHKYSDRDG